MSDVFVAMAAVILGVTSLDLVRLAWGRSLYDRLLAAGVVGTNTIVLLAVIGFIFERPELFVDLALTYALLNFIGTVAVAKYLEREAEEGTPG